MIDGLRDKKYLQIARKRFDPLALGISIGGLVTILVATGGLGHLSHFWDMTSFLIVVGGTFASLLFQYDFSTIVQTGYLVVKSCLGTPERRLIRTAKELDHAILNSRSIEDLRDGNELNGEIINDVAFMIKQGLYFDEIDEFVTARIKDEFFARQQSCQLLERAALLAPSVGLFGTVIGLVGVLNNLSSPTQIGPSMALALVTTAYGVGLAAVLFTPVAGRLTHHNAVFLEFHRQVLSKIGVLMKRSDRMINPEDAISKVVGV
jgi:chemotaxis protein MotA